MTGFQGADTAQLREHAELMRDRARTLGGLRTRLSMLVAHGAEWEGEDAQDFRDRWSSELAPAFDRQISEIEARGSSLDQEADEQDEVSQQEQAPGLLENILGLGNIGQDIFRAVEDLRKIVEDFPAHVKEWKTAFKDGPGALWSKYKTELSKGLKEALNFGEEYSSIAKKLVGKLGLPGALGNWDPLKKHLDNSNFPDWLGKTAPDLAKLGKIGGKLIPGLDIGLGVHQMLNGDSAVEKVSGGLSAVSGGMVLAAPLFGPAAPIVAGIGVGVGVVSIGMDLGKLAWDNREAIGEFVGNVGEGISDVANNVADAAADAASNAAETIGNGIESAGDALKDAGSAIGNAFGFG